MNNTATDRFLEEPIRPGLSRRDRDEDGYPDVEEETAKCECGRSFPLAELNMVNDGTDTPLFLCGSCLAYFDAQEKGSCTCEWDGRHNCDVHMTLPFLRPVMVEVRIPVIPEWMGPAAGVTAPAAVPNGFTQSVVNTGNDSTFSEVA